MTLKQIILLIIFVIGISLIAACLREEFKIALVGLLTA